MKYIANPVEVEAFKIIEIGTTSEHGDTRLLLDNHEYVTATTEMTCRIKDGVALDDYWVIQSDGYVYLNPKNVFERKYSPKEPA